MRRLASQARGNNPTSRADNIRAAREADLNGTQPTKRPKLAEGDITVRNLDGATARIRELPMPTLTVGKQPCSPYYRNGSNCKNRNCKLCHVPINKLPDSSKTEWFAHVKSVPYMHFNTDSVTCFEVSGALKPPT